MEERDYIVLGRWQRYLVAGIVTLLYAVSLGLPAFAPYNPQFIDRICFGWEAFRVGWRAILLFEPKDINWWKIAGSWVANPLIWAVVAATFAGWRRACRLAAASALIVCLSVLEWGTGWITSYPGYWVWLGSAVLLLCGSCFRWAVEPRREYGGLGLPHYGIPGPGA